MRFIWVDFKRGLLEKSFWGVVAIGGISCFIGLMAYRLGGDFRGGDEAFYFSQAFILPFIAPLLATLVYTDMILLEKECGYRQALIIRNKSRAYFIKRYIVNGVLSGLALSLPLSLLFLVLYVYGEFKDVKAVGQVLGMSFLFGMTYGNLGYSLTFVNQRRYIPVVAPQVLYLLCIYAFPYLGLEAYYPPLSFSPRLLGGEIDLSKPLLQLMLICGVTVVVMGIGIGWEKQVNKQGGKS